MKYLQNSISRYLKDLAAKTPAPGGGSAAALSAAMAASLISMSCRFTLGKDKYKNFQKRAQQILSRSLQLQKRLGELADEDIRAYRDKDFDSSIKVPADVCDLSYEMMNYGSELIEKGNKNLATDAALAVILCEASFIAGLFYIAVNLNFSKGNTKKYEHRYRRLKGLLTKVKQMRKQVEVKVGHALGR